MALNYTSSDALKLFLLFGLIFADWILLLLSFVWATWGGIYVNPSAMLSGGNWTWAVFFTKDFVLGNDATYAVVPYRSCSSAVTWWQSALIGGVATPLAITCFSLSCCVMLGFFAAVLKNNVAAMKWLAVPTFFSWLLILAATIIWGGDGQRNLPTYIPTTSCLPQDARPVTSFFGVSFNMVIACVFLEALLFVVFVNINSCIKPAGSQVAGDEAKPRSPSSM
jgi:hypothetical protein